MMLTGLLTPTVAVLSGGGVAQAATPQALILGPSTACTNNAACGVQNVFQNTDSANDGKSLEQQEAEAAGFQVTIVTTAQWQAMSAAQFAAYQLLIIGDPHCDYDTAFPYGADANQSVWAGAVQSSNGNKVLIGTDPVFHNDYTTHRGDLLLKNSFAFAGGRTGSTGVSIDLSCFYGSSSAGTPVPLLNGLTSYSGPNLFTVGGAPCAGNIAIVAQSGPTSGMNDGMLSGWECSVHEFFNAFPPDYLPLAIATDPSVPQTYTAPDVGGSGATVSGSPYIMMAGPGVSVRPTNGPTSGEIQGGTPGSENGTTCSSSSPVNCATGDFWHTFNDLSVPGRGVALNFTRNYSAAMAANGGPLGFGWTDSYNLFLTIDSSGNVSVHQQNGSVVIFSPNGSGGYTAPTRVLASLVKNSDGSYTFTPNATLIAYKFSAGGQLLTETDRNGYVTTLAYSGSNLTTVTDPAGRKLTFTYSGANISSVTDPGSRVVSFTYDSSGNLATATNPAAGKWSFTYDSSHRLLTMTDPRGGVTTNTYDSTGRVTQQVDPLGRKTTWSYSGDNTSATGGTTTQTDPNGNQSTYNFQLLDLVSVTRAANAPSLAATTTYAYDPTTLAIISVTDPDGHVTNYSYDNRGNRLTATDPLGHKRTFTYNSFNEVVTDTDPAGTTTTYTYDIHGNLTGISRPLVGASQTQQSTFTYGDSTHPGDVTSGADPDGKVSTFTYDAAGDMTKKVDPAGNATTYTYNSVGQRTTMVSPNGNVTGGNPASNTTSFTYDPLGDLTQTTDPLGHTTKAAYDANQNPATLTDPDNHTTTYTYDADSELTKTTRADGTSLSYTYDANGNQLTQTDEKANVTTNTYDQLNRLASTTDPLGHKTTYTYDAAGNRLTVVNPAGQTTTSGYNAANQLTAITYSDGKTPNVTNIGYDLDGERTAMTDGTGTSNWTYDSLNRLTSYTNGAGAKVSYGYDLKNQETSITYPGSTGTVTRAYDAAGNLTSVTDPSGKATAFGYNPNQDNTSQTLPSATGVTDSYTYNAANQLTAISDAQNGTAFASFAYTLDPSGQATAVTSTGVPADNHTYSYDQLTRLTGVDTSTYTYDAADNLTKLASGTTQSFNAADQLTNSGNGTFSYDTQGNRISGPDTLGANAAYTYNQQNSLTSTTVSGTSSAGLVAGGQYHSLAVNLNGNVYAWGYNANGQLGNGNTTNSDVPVQVPGISSATGVTAGDLSSGALLAGGTVKTWGYNGYGQLGNGTTTSSSTPVSVTGLAGVTAIASGNYHMLALEPNGTVMAWGLNNAGQLGDGTVTNRTTPVAVKVLSSITQVAAGGLPGYAGQSVALKSDGTVWTWGYGKQGQLGLGSNTSTVTPTQVPGLSGITQIAANGADTYALKSDGTVWAWGDNAYGQIGNNAAGQTQSTPIKVNITSVTSIGAGATAAFAIKSDGTTWGWGDDNTGQLGDGAKCGKTCTNPVQVQGLTGATSVTGGYVHTLASRSDGTVWAWGRNAEGELGDGNTTVSTTPVQATGVSNVKPIPPVSVTYTYNGDGLRMSKTANGTTSQYTWDTSGKTPLLLSDGTNSYIYGPAGLPVEEISTTATYYYHHDRLGSTRVLTDSTGKVAATYTYDAYGNTTATTGTVNNPLRYAGAFTDLETGFIYLVNRYYDTATGQFLSVDPLAQFTHQPYAYGKDNPVNNVDPTGLDPPGVPTIPVTVFTAESPILEVGNFTVQISLEVYVSGPCPVPGVRLDATDMSATFSAGGIDATFSLTKGDLTAVSGSTYFYSKEIPFAGDNIGIEASVTWTAKPPSGGGGFGDWVLGALGAIGGALVWLGKNAIQACTDDPEVCAAIAAAPVGA